jgi:hypothetical protein
VHKSGEDQEYFLQRKNVNQWSPKTMRICYCGIRFFYQNVLRRNWHLLGILRAQNEHRLLLRDRMCSVRLAQLGAGEKAGRSNPGGGSRVRRVCKRKT